MDRDAFLDGLEHQLIEGSGRWVAEFPEAIRSVRVGKVDFDLLVKGSTRGRSGYFLSAITARMTLPDYSVAALVKVKDGSWTPEELEGALDTTRRFMERFELTWTWLLLAQNGKPSKAAESTVRRVEEREIGMALVDTTTMAVVHSPNLLGRNIARVLPRAKVRRLGRGGEVSTGWQHRLQWSRLVGLFGAFLLLVFLTSSLGLWAATGRGAVPVPLFIGNMAVAAVLAYVSYLQRYRTDFFFDEEKFRVVIGASRKVEARWRDYDMVSLFHMGGGRYHLTLYRQGDHTKFVDIPASTVGLDPDALRRRAMELTTHAEVKFPDL